MSFCYVSFLTLLSLRLEALIQVSTPLPNGYLFDYTLNIYLLKSNNNNNNTQSKHKKDLEKVLLISYLMITTTDILTYLLLVFSSHFRPNKKANKICLCSCLLFGFCVLPFCSTFLHSIASYFFLLALFQSLLEKGSHSF